MYSNIRFFLIVLFISTTTFAQETHSEETEIEENGHKVGNVIIGAYFPIAFGDNFVNNGMDLKGGGKIALKVNTYKTFFVGPYLSFFKGSVTDQVSLGNYESTTNILIGGVVGYDFYISNFDVSIGAGVGYSVYANRGLGDKFNDTATALWFSPEVSYRLNTYLGIFMAPELRHDFMNIDVPSELEDSFGGVNYFNISFGLRINLGSGYKFQ
ncbi:MULTISPECIES: hypothetical protein [Aequorivita]|uniref:Outer membrane protein beta-barrel domain-containing protein n=1 Tax=Aequorivita iocasae TaxID=2803865 RepID=A0ABX7DRI9_9FLAO|nr:MULTISPECIES: hypothetical protein [Aequorivita]QQX76623.1 hypothetical protein JK629_15060 [Aequorivita iocasae]UCA56094.1 hypothetical protein LDL78_15130 [Aequorivita sp. F7]